MKQFVRPVRVLPAVSALAVAALMAACAVATEEARYPIKLNPRLGLASTDATAIDARLAGPLWPSMPEEPGLEIYLFREDPWVAYETPFEDLVIDIKVAANCIELRALTDAGYLGRYRNDRGVQQGLLKKCEAIEMLRTARQARVSYVHDFVMRTDAVDVMPVMVDQGFRRRLCDEYLANQRGIPWSAFDRIVEVNVRDDYTVEVKAEQIHLEDDELVSGLGVQTWINLLAWADFNGDGIEDLLISSRSTQIEWQGPARSIFFASTTWDELYVVSREAPGDVLRVVDAERYLTPERLGPETCP